MTFYIVIFIFALISELISIIFVFKKGQERLTLIWKPLLTFLVFSFLIDSTSFILSFYGINNYMLLHLYGLIEVFSFGMIFYRLDKFITSKYLSSILLISIILCLIESIMYPTDNNFWSNLSLKFILTFLSGFYIYKLLSNYSEVKDSGQSYFFFFLAVFISSLSFFYFSLFEELVRSKPFIYENTWFVPILITISFNLVLTIPLWKKSIL